MPKATKKDKEEEVVEVAEEQPEVPETVEEQPEVQESPEEPEDAPVEEQFIDLDSVTLVFDKKTVDLWLSKSGARITNAVDSAMLLPQALVPKQTFTLLVFAIQSVKPGGLVIVPEVFLGSEYLEPLEYLGPVGDFFAFRK